MTEADTPDTNLVKLRSIEADIATGKFSEAAAALNALSIASPTDARIYLTAAILARAAKNPRQEILSLQHAIAAAPRWLPAQIELARVLSREGQHAQAIAVIHQAAVLEPREINVLEAAVAIANAAGDFVAAQGYLQTALELRPDDTQITSALAVSLAKQSYFEQAEIHLRRVLDKNPDDPFALGWLGTCLIGLGRKDEAATFLAHGAALVPENESLRFYLAIARGETPRTQPKELMREFFDGYASQFDQHLVGKLKYRVPIKVAEIILKARQDRDISVLDLGCGTGLLGAYLGRIKGAFVGVDVSVKMIEQAVRYDVYTDLRQADLLEELQRTSPGSFDYITANDVFIYVGDLCEIIPASFVALRSGGTMIFSCETASDDEGALVLRPSKRYAHSRRSIEALCRDAGFSRCVIEPIDLRLDEGTIPVAGFIAVAHKQ
ncbi:tetratricopeptide repeat protein [Pseudolysobacter antarcticus]|uniref:Tetratricopeptide repeat protein n=1 Tax=Pseudolysobacter antarcticus TaxID=2511995 RepID=A0A411HL79_9GAMM|nr:tetratricopeptide repeat protein [Pseudolysobacter antarcticus]QBB71253.1 tetratricopeptide repeat protein [Pseudolysobacter antarcticus]